MNIQLISKTLLIASLGISISNNAYANNNSFLEVIVKIYQAAKSINSAQSASKSNQTQPEVPSTVPPENFSKEASNTPLKASNSTVESTSVAPSSNELRDPYLEGLAADKRGDEEMRANAARVQKMNETTEADKKSDDALYVEEFNKRHLTNSQFQKVYQNYIYRRHNVNIADANDQEKIALEKRMQFQEEVETKAISYHKAFQKHIRYVVKDMGLSFQQLRELMVNGDPDIQKGFDLNPAGDAITMKYLWSGIAVYEHNHPELDTNCMWGLGGRNEYLPDCDKVFTIITTEYVQTHGHTARTITKADLRKIAHAINPHETLD